MSKAHIPLARPQLHAPYTFAAAATILALATITVAAGRVDGYASQPSAHDAGTLNVTDTAHLHSVSSPGSSLIEEGTATGGLPGKVKVDFNVGPKVTATFTIYTHAGSITGHGVGTLHGTGVYASFGGTMSVASGTGRYTHAHGHGGFYGVIDRNTYALTVQTTGSLSY